MPVKIKESGLRWWLAQALLSLLYWRRYHFISPWKGAGAGACVVFHHDGKVLLSKRSGNIEGSGKYGIVGGFMDVDKHETLAENLVREIWEETGLTIDPALFPQEDIHYVEVSHGREMLEAENYTAIVFYFWHEMSAAEIAALKPLHETAGFIWVDSAELEELVAADQFPFEGTLAALRQFFAAQK